MKTTPGNSFIVAALAWSTVTLALEVRILLPAAREIAALQHASTEGTILSSQLIDKEGGDGPQYDAALAYTYRVGGREYTGSRYYFGGWHWVEQPEAFGIIHAHPPGAKMPVFYDPAKPWNSVLSTGLTRGYLLMFALIPPFNAVMLWLWWVSWSGMRSAWRPPVAGGVKLVTETGKTRARLTPYSPFGVALATTTLLAFLSLFFVGSFGDGFYQVMRAMAATCCLILSGGLVAGAYYTLKILSGKFDLVIDRLGGALDLPPTLGRKIRRRVPFGSVQDVRVVTVRKPSSKDGDWPPTFVPTLEISGTGRQFERLVEWRDVGKADGFVDWLRDQLPEKPHSPRHPPNS